MDILDTIGQLDNDAPFPSQLPSQGDNASLPLGGQSTDQHFGQTAATDDPFNLENLRLSQDFAVGLSVKKALLTIPVRRPDRQWWLRVHPSEDYRIQTAVIEMKEDRETYLVHPSLWSDLRTEIVPKVLLTSMTRQDVLFLWQVRLPGVDGKIDEWNRSALEAATLAMKKWVRVSANMALGAYEVVEADADIPEPTWPAETFQELLRKAFKDRFIQTSDHPVIQRLRGKI